MLELNPQHHFVTVCDEKCELDADASDQNTAVCKVPKLSTVFSNQNFKVETESEDLKFKEIMGNLQDIDVVFDNQLTVRTDIDRD